MRLEGPIDLEEFLASFQELSDDQNSFSKVNQSSVLDAWKDLDLAGFVEPETISTELPIVNAVDPQKQLIPLMTPLSKSISRDSMLSKLEEVWEPSFETPAGSFSRLPKPSSFEIRNTPVARQSKNAKFDESNLETFQHIPSSPKDLFNLRSEHGELDFSLALDDVIANATQLTPLALRSPGICEFEDADDLFNEEYDYLEDIDFDGQEFTQIHCNSEVKPLEKENSFMLGFQTAAGKVLEMPTEKSILKAKALLKDDIAETAFSHYPELEAATHMPVGFTTAGGKKIKDPSPSSLIRARQITEDLKELPPVMNGFATASGARIKIKDESLNRAKRLFDEIDDTNQVDPKPMSGFSTAKGTSLPPSSTESIAKARTLLCDDSPAPYKEMSELPFFSSGAGKRLPPPNSNNIKKAKMLLDEVSSPSISENSIKIPPTIQSGFEFASVSDNLPSESSDVRARSQLSDPFNKTPSTANYSPRLSGIFNAFKCNNGITPMSSRFAPKLSSSPQFRTPCRLTRSGSSLKMEVKNEVIAPKSFFDWSVTEKRMKLSSMTLDMVSDDIPQISKCTYKDCFNFKIKENHMFWGFEEAHSELLNQGVISTTINREWVRNHYGLIVWKIGSTIRNISNCIYPIEKIRASIMSQLSYRYEREINLAQRSCLKKIAEGDDPVAGLFTFCVADFRTSSSDSCPELLLTDGWYSMWIIIDKPTTTLIQSNKLFLGQKIQICNLMLTKSDPVAILDAESHGLKLKGSYNSLRMERWHALLGRHRSAISFSRPLKTIKTDGGVVPCIEVVIIKTYPETIVISMEDGKILEKSKKEFQMIVDAQTIDPSSLKSVSKSAKILVEDTTGQAIVKLSNISDELLLKFIPGRQLMILNSKPRSVSLGNSLELRVYQSCKQCIPKAIVESFTSIDEDYFPKEFVPGQDYNLVLKFLRQSKNENYAWALTANGLLVTLSLGSLTTLLPSFTENDIFVFRNLDYQCHDSKINVDVFQVTLWTEWEKSKAKENKDIFDNLLQESPSIITNAVQFIDTLLSGRTSL